MEKVKALSEMYGPSGAQWDCSVAIGNSGKGEAPQFSVTHTTFYIRRMCKY
jgi:hypothetical protein